MPAVLVETGFLSNNQEEYYLSSQKGQAYIASAMFRAIQNYVHQAQQPQNKEHQWMRGSVKPAPSIATTNKETSVVYKIQLAAASKPSSEQEPWASIDGLEYYPVEHHYKYLVGSYTTKAQALASQAAWRRFGFVDAFVVMFKNGQLVTKGNAF